jgi:hypothetical protein
LDVDLAEGDRRLAGSAPLEGGLGLGHRSGGIDGGLRGPALTRRRGPVRQAVEAGVELDHRAADLPGVEPVGELAGHVGVREKRRHPLRVGVADHRLRAKLGSILERHALAGRDPRHRDAAREDRAVLRRGVGDRERAHAHAALDVAPHRALPVQVALVVHELDRGRAGLVGAAPGADDPLAEERRLDPIVVEVAVEDVGDRGLEDEVDHLL